MSVHVGIDLGTTNSAICSYDGEEVTLYKSPEQTDVTPSAIFMDRRGNRYVGMRAYNASARDPGNAATLFKRLMGTSTPINLPALNIVMTPEQCSAEVLKTLFGYLPEAIRNSPDIGTVITVPAAFNQMQKDATLQAAEAAGLESSLNAGARRGCDERDAEAALGRYIPRLRHRRRHVRRRHRAKHRRARQPPRSGGIPMCGGRDFDRILVDNIVVPWLFESFDLAQDFASQPDYKRLRLRADPGVAGFSAEN
jgi:molecular chaperone DnaK